MADPKKAAQIVEMALQRAKKSMLSQAEKDANLKQWMSSGRVTTEEGDPQRLYHITPNNFDQFKAGGDDPTKSGHATWLTDNPEYQPASHNVGGAKRGFKVGTNVMPVYSNAQNPLMLDDRNMLEWAQQAFANGSKEFPELLPKQWADEIRKEGYDYIHLADPYGTNAPHEYIMLDPERQIKSAIGNRGTYDTTNPDITKAHGGSVHMKDGGSFNPQGSDYDYQTARAYGMGQDGGNWGSVAPTSDDERRLHGLPEDSYVMLKGAEHPTWGKAVEAEQERGSKIVKHGDRYYSVPRFDEGGDVDAEREQAELDRMRLELSNSPVIQATPQSTTQKLLGTVGGYMDRAGKFINESLEPIAQSNPVKTFLADMLLASPLKGAGTALQDYTKTSRDITEEQPYTRSPLTGSGETLRLDPRVLDIAQFASPVVRGATKLAGEGAKAIAPFAKSTAEMAADLYSSGKMPFTVAPNAYMAEPSVPKPSRVLAPANEQGFYSPTEAAALNLQRKTGNGQAFLNDILKQENVRPDEIEAIGLDTFLKDKKNVTATEVQDYIAQNKLGLGETLYGAVKEDPVGMANRKEIFDFYQPEIDRLYKKHDAYFDAGDNASRRKVEDQIINVQLKRNAEANSAYEIPNSKPTKFEEHALPGGENYREVVLTLPSNRPSLKNMSRSEYNAAVDAADKAGVSDYKSTHWDEPNPLAHLRMSDRVTDGKKTLLVDEVQSDWHQAGREQGYRIPDPVKKNEDGTFTVIQNDGTVMNFPATTDINMLRGSFGADAGVPNAPYKEDWYQLALRRAVKEAIDGGYDRVALITGDRVNDRFDLSKKIDRIDYNKNPDGTYRMSASQGGEEVFVQEWIKEKELSNILGKELANKLIKNEGELPPKDILKSLEEEEMPVYKTLSGLDLKVGGEGNRKYYDEVYPNYLKKLGKKYGATVGETTVKHQQFGAPEPLHYMEITPAMRKEFSTGIHMKDGGSVNLAEGGIVAGAHGLEYTDDGKVSMEDGGYVPMRRGGKVELTNDLAKMRNELQMKKRRK
jgi:hypothetical protein